MAVGTLEEAKVKDVGEGRCQDHQHSGEASRDPRSTSRTMVWWTFCAPPSKPRPTTSSHQNNALWDLIRTAMELMWRRWGT